MNEIEFTPKEFGLFMNDKTVPIKNDNKEWKSLMKKHKKFLKDLTDNELILWSEYGQSLKKPKDMIIFKQ